MVNTMLHVVSIGFSIEADSYSDALTYAERWLLERREGNALQGLWPDHTVSAKTIPNLPHSSVSVEVEKMTITVEKPKKPPVPKSKVLKKFHQIEQDAKIEDLGGMDIVVKDFEPDAFDDAVDDDLKMEED
jgi:hypothetical protein